MIEEYLYINSLNPIERYESFVSKKNNDLEYVCDNILMCLYCVDTVLKSRTLKNYSFYIEDDDSIYKLLSSYMEDSLLEKYFDKSLFILDISKLMYRFTCATKFRINDDLVNQLRINSWGVLYLQQKRILSKYSEEYSLITNFFNQYFFAHEAEYSKLVDLLTSNITKKKCRIDNEFEPKIDY